MKLWVFSDLHLEGEWTDQRLELPQADVCVVAGDLKGSCAEGVHWLHRRVASSGMPCVYVAGNHEFYGNSVMEGLEWGREAARQCPEVHFLENRSVVLGGVRFLGCTLWTDFELDGDEDTAKAMASVLMNDYRRVLWRSLPGKEMFTPEMALELHQRSRAWLETELSVPFSGPSVVITHHAPHPYSVNPRFKGSALNAAFASDMADLIVSGRPNLWVHGHMHDSADYMVGSTRVLCNPAGYDRENGAFDPKMVVEV